MEKLIGIIRTGSNSEINVYLRVKDGGATVVFRSSTMGVEGSEVSFPLAMLVELKKIVNVLEEEFVEKGHSEEFETRNELKERRQIVFSHPSEEEFARILDFYQIKWEYEPRTFPIEWDEEGNVTESFTPDFYLPEQDLYIELTTLKQSLVTKKNRKVRRLKELYPDINIKIFYGKDYMKLLEKFDARKKEE